MKGKSKQLLLFIHSSLDTKKRETVFNDIWKDYYPKLTVYLKTTYPETEIEDIVQEIPVGTLKYLVHNIKKDVEAHYIEQYGNQYGE